MDLKSTLILFIIVFSIFLLLRSVNLWYWKINKSIELHEETNMLLTKIKDLLTPQNTSKSNVSITEQTSVNNPEVLNSIIDKLNSKR